MKAVKRVPVVQQVVEEIKKFLFSGKVSVGDKMPVEMELCRNLGVGRGTVREAFRILEATGYVEIKPGKGAFAARVSEVELEEIAAWFVSHEVETKDFLEVRMVIEPDTVRLAIQRCIQEDVEKLRGIHEKMIKAVSENDISQIASCDEKFHAAIVEFSRNKLLISISKQIEKNLKEFRSKTFYFQQNADNVIEPHRKILEAFEKKDPEAGKRYMKEHLAMVAEDLEKSKR